MAPLQGGTLSFTVGDATLPGTPLISVNPAFCALTGYAESEVLGRNCSFMQDERTDRNEISKLRQAIATGIPAHAVLANVRRDGSRFLNEVILNPVRDATGRLRYITGIQRDVTVGESIRAVRFALLPDGSIKALDHPNGLGRAWIGQLSAVEKRRLEHAASVVVGSGSMGARLDLKIDMTMANAMCRSWAISATATRLADTFIFGGFLTTTAQDDGLQMRLRLLEGVASSGSDVILITEAEPVSVPGPRIIYANDALERHTGYRPDEVIGRNPRLFQGPLSDPAVAARIGAALRAWQPVQAQLVNYRKDNSTFWIDLSIAPVADKYGWWTNWIAVQRDETERRASADLIAYQASHDSLTGLANRGRLAAAFDRMVEEPFDRMVGEPADRTVGEPADRLVGEPVDRMVERAIVQIDLDRFKSINDTFGHAAGDAVLVEAARRLAAYARPEDVVGRVGGDKFLVMAVWPDGDASLDEVAERLRAAVTGPFVWRERELQIMASVGAAFYPRDGDTLEGLMVAADISLARAKQRGRGCAEVFTPELRGEASAARALASALHAGLELDEFEPFFQPQVSIKRARVIGLEVLMRWRHPAQGVLAPREFMAAATEAGLMAKLDEHMLDRSLRIAAGWRRAGLEFGRIAVNLSGETFASADLVGMITRRLALHEMPAEMLTIEMVEGVFIGHNADDVVGKLAALRGLGVSVDLDDFGTGYASLTHLRRFAIDRLKLDRSFVMGIGDRSGNEIIVTAIVGLAASLGLACVAEGVETAEQLRFLTKAGCDEIQGFLFSQPLDQDAMSAWLRSGPFAALAPANAALAGADAMTTRAKGLAVALEEG